MGVDAADFDGDGKQDLFVANVDQEMFSLYQNDGNEFFSDVAARQRRRAGDAAAERLGPEVLRLRQRRPRRPVPRQRPSRRHDREVLAAGEATRSRCCCSTTTARSSRTSARRPARSSQKLFPARGLAVGDYNNDGRIDVLIGNNGGAPVLLKNNAGEGNHWLGLKLQGTTCNRDAIGARITWSVGGKTRSRCKIERRQLPVVARPARGARPRHRRRSSTGSKSSGRSRAAASSASPTCPIDRYVTIVEGKGRVE